MAQQPTTPSPGAVVAGEPSITPSRPAAGNHDTVTVGCKLPNGLILRNYAWHPHRDALAGGGFSDSKIARRIDDTQYVVHGNTVRFADLRAGNLPDHSIVGGFGLTSGIPRDFWERWLELNKDTALVKNGLVFAHEEELSARSMAKERAALRSGLEPIDPERPYLAHPEFGGIRQGTRDSGADE